MPKRFRRLLYCLHTFLLLALVLIAGPAALAQDGEAPVDDAEFIQTDSVLSASTPVPEGELALLTARRLARAGLLFSRSIPEPRFPEYRVAALILREAYRLAPQDPDILRLYIESLHATGDIDEELRLSAELLKLDPDDVVLQLRIITARINRLQTAEERLRLYDRLLGRQGESLDNSLRSRLAFDAAILAREMGRDEQFVDYLTLATQLDITNKSAAGLAASYYMDQTEDPLGRVELLVNVLLADPVDPTAMINLARELMSHGATRGAQRFYENASYVLAAVGVDMDDSVRDEYLLTRWDIEGAEPLLEFFREQEAIAKYSIEQAKLAAEEEGLDPDEIAPWRPTLSQSRIRLATASALGRDDQAFIALQHLQQSTDEALQSVQDARTRLDEGVEEGDFDPDDAAETYAELDDLQRKTRSEILWLRAWSGFELDKAKEAFAEIRDSLTEGARHRFEGIMAIQEGRIEEGRAILASLAETDARALVGLGLAYEIQGDTKAAASYYARAALRQPGTIVSEWCKTVIERMHGVQLEQSPIARSLEEYAAELPRSLDEIVRQPRSFQYLSVEQDRATAHPLDPCYVTVTLRNVNRTLPLALGERRPLNSSIMLAAKIDVRGQLYHERSRPEIIRLDRRLRLLPGESLTMRIWAGRGETGLVLDDLASHRIGLRWRAIQGFRLVDETAAVAAHYGPGPLCIDAVSERQSRSPLGGAGASPELVKRRLTLAEGNALLESLIVARSALVPLERLSGAAAVAFQERISEIAQIVADRLPTFSPLMRAYVLLLMPPARASQEFQSVDDVALEDSDRLVRFINLFSRTSNADDPIVVAALESEDPELREMAELLVELRGPGEDAREEEAASDAEEVNAPGLSN